MSRRRVVLTLVIIGLAPVVITPTNHIHGEATWVVPVACAPFPALLANTWPGPGSLWTIGGFVLLLVFISALVRGFGLLNGSGSAQLVGILSLLGPAFIATSMVLMGNGSGILSLIWSGAATVVSALFLLYATRRVAVGSQFVHIALIVWLAGEVALGGIATFYGVAVGLCC